MFLVFSENLFFTIEKSYITKFGHVTCIELQGHKSVMLSMLMTNETSKPLQIASRCRQVLLIIHSTSITHVSTKVENIYQKLKLVDVYKFCLGVAIQPERATLAQSENFACISETANYVYFSMTCLDGVPCALITEVRSFFFSF